MRIPKFDTYSSIINEGFVIQDNVILFDSLSNDLINTSFGKGKLHKPYQMKLPFGIAYSVYQRTDDHNVNYVEVLNAIKGKSSIYTIDANSYSKFINRTSIYMADIILKEEIDTIILLESSSSLIANLSNELNRHLPKYYDMVTYNAGIFKNPNFDEIIIQGEKFGLKEKNIKTLQADIDRQRKNNYFSIKKFAPQFRDVISNWLKINDKILSKIVDKNVCVIDDTITTGSSLKESSRLLEDAGAKK